LRKFQTRSGRKSELNRSLDFSNLHFRIFFLCEFFQYISSFSDPIIQLVRISRRLFSTPSLQFGRPLALSLKDGPKMSKKNSRDLAKAFSDFPLLPEVQVAISNSGILVPTSAQQFGIPRLLNNENLLLISQTGKGKTLAYLIPLIDKLIRTNQDKLYPQPQRPRAIIVVPTRELVVQTMGVIRKIFGSSVSSLGLAPHYLSFVKEHRIIQSVGADLIVTTPSRLELHLKRGPNNGGLCLSSVQSFVFDEADTLCDSVYEQGVREMIKKLQSRKKECQIVIVGATRTAAVNEFVNSIPGLSLAPVLTSDAHTVVKNLEQVFVPVRRRKRTNCLSEILENEQIGKTLIFTNSVKTCNFVSKFLRESDTVSSTSVHGEMNPKLRAANFKKFADTDSGCNLMVCTNLLSRGIDLDNVTHVIMYDFPHTLADYLHRAGRTGRAGRLGKVTALYTKRNMALARQIEQAAKEGKPIEYVKGKASNVAPRKAVKLEKYKSALDQLKRAPKRDLRRLRGSLGMPPHDGVGSVEIRAVAKQWRSEHRKNKELEFIKKRKRVLKKVDSMPELPNRTVEASETRSKSKIVRSRSGDLQFVSSSR